jgi:glycosyltransferase involved in cell wall biosynthesis
MSLSSGFQRAFPFLMHLSDLSPEEAAMLRCAVVIPAYNHGRQIRDILAKTLRFGFPVFVVDDGSTDSTPEILASFPQVTVVRHEMNQGKGASLLDGFAAALKSADCAVTLDADGQHNPDDIPSLVKAVQRGNRPLVIGKRSGMEHPNVPWTSRWGRRFSNFWVWASCGKWIFDSQSGFRLYPLPEALRLGAGSRRFEFEVEILVRAVWSGSYPKSLCKRSMVLRTVVAFQAVDGFLAHKDITRLVSKNLHP